MNEMTCLKSILFTAAVFIAVGSVKAAQLKSNDFIECPDTGLREEQLVSFTIHQPGQAYNVQNKDFTFPDSGNQNTRRITCIQIFDLSTDGTGGYATITSGGLTSRYVTINLKSQMNKGLDFKIILWTPLARSGDPKLNHE